jgi:hypothetical protein
MGAVGRWRVMLAVKAGSCVNNSRLRDFQIADPACSDLGGPAARCLPCEDLGAAGTQVAAAGEPLPPPGVLAACCMAGKFWAGVPACQGLPVRKPVDDLCKPAANLWAMWG